MKMRIQEGIERQSFEDDVYAFIDHIESLAVSLPMVLETVEASHQKAVKVRNEFLEKDCEKRLVEGELIYYVKAEHSSRNRLLLKEVNQSAIAQKILFRNYVVSLVSQFDSFIGSIIKTMFYLRPDLLNQSEKPLTFSNLMDFGSIETARNYIIEKEIESVLRENHANHFKWLESKLNVQLRKDLAIWPTFIELTERRNLYVHNNGIVSNQYIKICSEHKVNFEVEPKAGSELGVTIDYFDQAFKCVFELGIKLSQVMWRKLLPKKIEDSDRTLLNISFELIQNKQYVLAQELLDFCDKYITSFSSEDMKLRLIMNRAQAYKWQGNEETCKEIINKRDWTASSDMFKLASQVLLDDFENAFITMKSIGSSSDHINQTSYKEWPIFREFRKHEKFNDVYKEVFGEPVEVKEAFSSSGFKLLDQEILLQRLDECLKIAQMKQNGFVGTKFFVETDLAKRGHDISVSWALLNDLIENGTLENYTHENPDGHFLPLSAIRRSRPNRDSEQ